MIAVRTWSRRRIALVSVLAAGAIVAGYFGYLYIPVLYGAATTPGYWRGKANEPVPTGALRLVALGDSATQAIGATHPEDGFVGRIAAHAHAVTGRPVHIQNLAKG